MRMEERGEKSVWADLPVEVLKRIMDLLDPSDRIAVGLVCASWRACVREHSAHDVPFEIPRLLVGRGGGELAFFSLQHERMLPFTLLTRPRGGGRCCGHVAGWLALAFDSDRTVSLCNPVSGHCVGLPRPPVFPVKKVIVSGPPTSPGWVAVVLGRTGTMVALLHPGSCSWMTMGIGEAARHGGFIDMAFWNGGRLAVLCHDGAVFTFRGRGARAAVVSQLRKPERVLGMPAGSWWKLYLVEVEGDLMLVRKLYVSLASGVVEWDVKVRLLASPEMRSWDPVPELPGLALFVGSVVSVAVPVEPYGDASGMRESCVYFARREAERVLPHAIFEYSLEDDDIKVVAIPGGHNADVEPVWITPFV